MTDTANHLAAALRDRYLLQRELGRGGMATVYLAEDLRPAQLQHPHILPLFDSGVVEGLLYYVMPHVEGETLRARLARERQLPVADAVRIASEVADARSGTWSSSRSNCF